jgi:hypothetical protein
LLGGQQAGPQAQDEEKHVVVPLAESSSMQLEQQQVQQQVQQHSKPMIKVPLV